MRIAIVTELFHPHIGGCEKRFMEIGKRLSKKNEVHIFTILYENKLPKEEIVEDIFINRYAYSENYIKHNSSRSLFGVLKYSLMTLRKVLTNNFDIYYFNQWPILHSIFSKPFAFPLVQEWCEVWSENKRIVILEKMLKRVTKYHVAVSKFTKHRLINFLRIKPENVTVIPNGVDYQKFSKETDRKKWGKIIYIGRIVPHKRLDLLLLAKKKLPNTELHIIGSGESLLNIKKQAAKLKDVYIHGSLPEDQMLKILKDSWIFILPSEREGSGIAALEAMAAGIPVITVDSPNNATKEIINGMNGVVVPAKADSVAEAISNLLSDESRWHEMSSYAKCFAKRFDWDVIAYKMEEYLKKIIDGE